MVIARTDLLNQVALLREQQILNLAAAAELSILEKPSHSSKSYHAAIMQALDLRGDQYQRSVIPYINYLVTDELITTSDYDSMFDANFPSMDDLSETANLFKTPKAIMGTRFAKIPHFGIPTENGYYNFDEPLRALLRIELLYAACANDTLNTEWLNQQFIRLKQQIDLLSAAMLHAKQDRTAFNQQFFKTTPINVRQQALNMIFGPHLIMTARRVTHDATSIIQTLHHITTLYYHGIYRVKYNFISFLGTSLLFERFFASLPAAILSSIIESPLRLAKAIGLLLTRQSPEKRQRMLLRFKKIESVMTVLRSILRWTLLGPTIFITAVPSFIIGLVIHPLIGIISHLLFKPIHDGITALKTKRQITANAFAHLRSTLTRHLDKKPKYANIEVQGHAIDTPQSLYETEQALRHQKQISSFQWLHAILKHQHSYILSLGKASGKMNYIVFMGPQTEPTFTSDLEKLILNTDINTLEIDWQFYHSDKNIQQQTLQMMELLSRRTLPIKNIKIICEKNNKHTIKAMCQSITENPHLRPTSIAFEGMSFTDSNLENLLHLILNKPSINKVLSLPFDAPGLTPAANQALSLIRETLAERNPQHPGLQTHSNITTKPSSATTYRQQTSTLHSTIRSIAPNQQPTHPIRHSLH